MCYSVGDCCTLLRGLCCHLRQSGTNWRAENYRSSTSCVAFSLKSPYDWIWKIFFLFCWLPLFQAHPSINVSDKEKVRATCRVLFGIHRSSTSYVIRSLIRAPYGWSHTVCGELTPSILSPLSLSLMLIIQTITDHRRHLTWSCRSCDQRIFWCRDD